MSTTSVKFTRLIKMQFLKRQEHGHTKQEIQDIIFYYYGPFTLTKFTALAPLTISMRAVSSNDFNRRIFPLQMTVAMVHNGSLDEMETAAKAMFAAIRNKNIPERIWPSRPFKNSQVILVNCVKV